MGYIVTRVERDHVSFPEKKRTFFYAQSRFIPRCCFVEIVNDSILDVTTSPKLQVVLECILKYIVREKTMRYIVTRVERDRASFPERKGLSYRHNVASFEDAAF